MTTKRLPDRVQRSDDPVRQQELARDVARGMNRIPFAVGKLIRDCALTNGQAFLLDHNLGQRAAAFVVRAVGTAVAIAESSDQSSADPMKQLYVTPNATTTADIWCYPRGA